MIAPLATSWIVVVEADNEDPSETTLEAFGPFAGSDARERASAWGEGRMREDVLSVAVLPLRTPTTEIS